MCGRHSNSRRHFQVGTFSYVSNCIWIQQVMCQVVTNLSAFLYSRVFLKKNNGFASWAQIVMSWIRAVIIRAGLMLPKTTLNTTFQLQKMPFKMFLLATFYRRWQTFRSIVRMGLKFNEYSKNKITVKSFTLLDSS